MSKSHARSFAKGVQMIAAQRLSADDEQAAGGARHARLALAPKPRPGRKWRWKPPFRPCAPPSCNMSMSMEQAGGDMRRLFEIGP